MSAFLNSCRSRSETHRFIVAVVHRRLQDANGAVAGKGTVYLSFQSCSNRTHLSFVSSCDFLQAELGNNKKLYEESMSAASEEHNAELARIDSKVRKALSQRDDSIQQLNAKLHQAEDKKIELERILTDLNSGLSAPIANRGRY